MSSGKIYFPGLNGIRCIAVAIVIFFHINHYLTAFNLTPFQYFEARDEMSRNGVLLFFVLSGYLITYLLLKEKEVYASIDLKKFYIRRILRIWPIYYTIIILTVLLLSFQSLYPLLEAEGHSAWHNIKTIILYSFFLPNFGIILQYSLTTIAPLWSVGIEEQFYVTWPILIKKSRLILRSMIWFLVGYMALKGGAYLYAEITGKNRMFDMLNLFSFDSLCLGGITAYLYFKQHRILQILYNRYLQAASWLLLIASLILGPLQLTHVYDKELYALAFAIIILNVSTNKKTIINLENQFCNFIGKISYGLYIYHMIILCLLSLVMKDWTVDNKALHYIIIFLSVISLSVLVSHLSYKYFESRFLTIKTRFMKIKSSNQQEEEADTAPSQQPRHANTATA
ncbi:acyltransferase [Paraflavitalea sp. CAU 1676]|uniref:acyltransferase family protein n=1 Tax=Paraflavitalea sp. CAU 1676 TaxID=3032598 RepID=UPI0023DCE1D7|nr:acyltransferase [Paraflavitalea sp. CAU 1676]MDF2189187.1 acyltransferase [Paraflavitalea sp. CAU 1676]